MEGDKLCDEFINANFTVRQIYLLASKRVKYEVLLAKISKKIEIVEVKQDELERMSNMSTAPEVLMLVDMLEEPLISDISVDLTEETVLMLDGVKDPGNLGTIIRIADWYGIKNIICSPDCVEMYNPKVVQSTMGSILRVKIVYTHLADYLSEHKEASVYGALLKGEDVYTLKGKMRGILLMGSESHGISEELLGYINRPITIPSWGEAESLNVAVATGILCSEVRRRDY